MLWLWGGDRRVKMFNSVSREGFIEEVTLKQDSEDLRESALCLSARRLF